MQTRLGKLCRIRPAWLQPLLWLLVTAALCVPGPLATAATESTKPLVFGVYAYIRSTEVHRKMAPLQQALEGSLAAAGLPHRVELRIFPSYAEGIQALVQGEVDLVRFGPVSYVLAKERNPGIQLLAMESKDGTKHFDGVISVPADSPVRSVQDLRGKRIAFGDRRSTTGRYLAQAALVKAGIKAKDLAGYAYLGRHDKVAFAVGAGNYDAGASNENTFHRYASEKGLRAVLRFRSVTKPWVARAGLDPKVFDALRQGLLELREPEALYNIQRSGFLPADDRDYDEVRQAMSLAAEFDAEGLGFGVYASVKPSDIYNRVRPVLDVLERELIAGGDVQHIRVKVFGTYREAIDALARGDVQFGRFGPASYVLSKQLDPSVRLLAKEDDRVGGAAGVFVVAADSPLSAVSELGGTTFAFANRYSTEGRYLAQAQMLKAGIRGAALAGYTYLGRHDRVAYAVAAGQYDAGVVRSDVLARYPVPGRLRVIGRFAAPPKVWVATGELDDGLFASLQQALLEIDDADALAPLGVSGFARTDDEAYDGVRDQMLRVREFDQHP